MEINILMAADNSYLKYLGTCFASILFNSKVDEEFNLYIVSFTGELTSDNLEKVKLLNRIKKFTLNVIEIDIEELSGFHEPAVTLNTYLRLFVPDRLPNLNKILYLDCDMIVINSLRELYSINLKEKMFGASLDSDIILKSSKVWEYEKKINPLYFNAGMLLMNLEEMRKDNLTKKMQEWLSEGRQLMFADQDALNALYKDTFVVTPLRFNAQFPLLDLKGTKYFPKDHGEYEEMENPVIIHFCTAQKPWFYLPEPPYKDEFKKYFEMTPWRGIKESDKSIKNILRKNCRRILSSIGINK